MIDWEGNLKLAQTAFEWTPSEFWSATVYEFETALLAKLRESEPEPLSDEQTMEFFDRLSGVR